MLPPALGSGISAYWFRGILSYNVQSLSSIFIVVFYSTIGLGSIYFLMLTRTKTQVVIVDKEKFTVRKEFQILLSPLILLPFTSLMLVNFLSGSGAGATLPFLPPYLKKLGAIPTELSLLVLVLNLSMGIATQFVTPLVKKFGDIPVFVATTSLSTLCLVGLAFSEDLQLASIFFILRGTFANMNAPISIARIFSYIDNRVRATGSAVGSNIRWIGYVIASPISGNIIDNQGYEVSFVFTAIIYIISMLLFVWTVKTKPDLETLLKQGKALDTGSFAERKNESL